MLKVPYFFSEVADGSRIFIVSYVGEFLLEKNSELC
jgi:hypothetical protein